MFWLVYSTPREKPTCEGKSLYITVCVCFTGWMYDAFQDYAYAFYMAGLMNIVGVLTMFFIPFFKQEGNLREKVLEERRKYCEDKERQEAASRTIVMTSFASTERIYLSNRDLMLSPYEPVAARKRAPHLTKIIEFTSFASSERIFLSSRDLIDPFPSNNNMIRCSTLDRALRRRDVVDGYLTLPHPRSGSAGSRTGSDSSKGPMEGVKIEGTGINPYNKRPLSLQLTSTVAPIPEHESELFPMPKTLESIRKDRIDEEDESHAVEQSPKQTPRLLRPESPTLNRLKKQTDTPKSTPRNGLLRFWDRLLGKTFRTRSNPEGRSTEVQMENDILIIDERLTVV